jgi:hypothetical protein
MPTLHARVVVVTVAVLLSLGNVEARCGKERWSVKTGTDADAHLVDPGTVVTKTVAQLRSLAEPASKPATKRANKAEKTVFEVTATLREFKWEKSNTTGDNDYHLVIKDAGGRTFIAEIPASVCVGGTSPFHDAIHAARDTFDAKFTATGSFQSANVPVKVTGVGFFDFSHGQNGAAPNQFEIHPVLGIEFPGAPEAAPAQAGPPTATVIRSSNVRSSPSDQSKIRTPIKATDVVTLLSPDAQNEYVHIETAQGVKGWVLAQNLRDND